MNMCPLLVTDMVLGTYYKQDILACCAGKIGFGLNSGLVSILSCVNLRIILMTLIFNFLTYKHSVVLMITWTKIKYLL